MRGSPAGQGQMRGRIWQMNVFGKILSDFVTAREAHLCGERGSPAVGKGVVFLRVGYAPQSGGKYGGAIFGG